MVEQSSKRYAETFDFDCYGHRVTGWQSRATGLTVVNVALDSPLVNLFVTIPTEIHDDTGCPHTLEHLCFMGSEKYPYKGVLDSVANRMFAQGTNAWTDVDSTVYTLQTVGQEGMLRFLPIYMDHLLRPTLTDSACLTEVFHINGSGEDAGVVFSEMQSRENSSGDLLHNSTSQGLFPPGSGYRSETGGKMECLRSLAVQTIRDYHAQYYDPSNICIVLTGTIDHERLMHVVSSIDDDILKSPSTLPKSVPHRPRPWVNSGPIPDLRENVLSTVTFPDQDESMGELFMSWLGPTLDDHITALAIQMVADYLTDSSVSVLQAKFVEQEDPVCTAIYASHSERLRVIMTFEFSSVPVDVIDDLADDVRSTIAKIKEHEFDMDRMSMLLHREKLTILNALESTGHDVFGTTAVTDFVYGDRSGKSLGASLGEIEYLQTLETWGAGKWWQLLQDWFVKNPSVVAVGKPSREMAQRLEKDEKERIEKRCEKLGEHGLQLCADALRRAQDENSKPIPRELIESFKIPDLKSIKFIDTKTARVGLLRENEFCDYDLQQRMSNLAKDIKLAMQLDSVNSAFMEINVYVATQNVTPELRKFLYILSQYFFACPVLIDGQVLGFEEMVSRMEKDLFAYGIDFGPRMAFPEVLSISLTVEKDKYTQAIEWLRTLFCRMEFDADRLMLCTQKAINDLPQTKRNGFSVTRSYLATLQLDEKRSTSLTANMLYQADALEELAHLLDENPEAALAGFKRLHAELFMAKNMRIHISGALDTVSDPIEPWNAFQTELGRLSEPSDLAPVVHVRDVMLPEGREPTGRASVLRLPTIESSYAIVTARGISEYQHPDRPALELAVEYLNAIEGLMWKYIRGSGLAYSSSISSNIELGQIRLSIDSSPDAFKAWQKMQEICHKLCSGEIPIDTLMVDGAKSSVVERIVTKEATMSQAANESFNQQCMRNQSKFASRETLYAVQKVNALEVKQAVQNYVMPLFTTSASEIVVGAPPSRATAILESLKAAGYAADAEPIDLFDLDDDDDDDDDDSDDEKEDGGSNE